MRQAAQKRPPCTSRGHWPAPRSPSSAAVECLLFLPAFATKTAEKCEPPQKRHGSCNLSSAAGQQRLARTTDLQGGASDFSWSVWWFAPDHTPLAGRSCRSRRPHFFFARSLKEALRNRDCGGSRPARTLFSGPIHSPSLDGCPSGALFCGVSCLPGRCFCRQVFPDCTTVKRQRSFNWQSTAFVMRGLWVRFPPLAVLPASAGLRLPRFLS